MADQENLKKEIYDTLLAVEAPTAFACAGSIDNHVNPCLHLNQHGTIGLPVSTHDVDVLISKSQQSPFGKGTETIVDTSVRKSWQLDPSEFSIRNPNWDTMMNRVFRNV